MNLNNKHYKILKFVSAHEGISYTDFLNDCPVLNLKYHVQQLTKSGYLNRPRFGLYFSSISMGKISNRMNTRTTDYRLPDTISITVKGRVALEEYKESKFYRRWRRLDFTEAERNLLIKLSVPAVISFCYFLYSNFSEIVEIIKSLLRVLIGV